MRRLTILLVVSVTLASVLGGCSKKSDEEVQPAEPAAEPAEPAKPVLKEIPEAEPNEKTDQAQVLQESCVVTASLEAAAAPKQRAKDWYKIAPATKAVVRIDVSAVPGEDLNLTVLDADKNRLFRVDAGTAGEGEGFPNLTVEREVYLNVWGSEGGKGGDYKLTVTMGDPVEGTETEANDRYSMATGLDVGGRVQGFLGHPRDEDWYLLSLKDLPTGSVLRIDITEVPGVRWSLEVLDQEERSPILKTSAADKDKGLVVRNLGLPGTPEAVFLVVKSGWVPGPQPKKFIQTSNPEVAYTLSVSSEAGGDDLEREPNDDPEHAIALLDGQKIRGYLSVEDDVDWYKIEVERPSLLAAELSALDRVDLQLYVVDPEKKDKKRDFELVRVNQGEVNEPETLTNCALAPGTNFVRVEGAWKNVDGKWVRDFVNLDETYSLTLTLRTDEGKEEREPNESVEEATEIKPGETLRGTLHPARDVDHFKLDLSDQDGPRTVVIECTGIPKVDISLALLGPEKDDKGRHKIVESSRKGQGEAKEQIQKELMPGEYHIQVSGSPRDESNTRDEYVLTVTRP